MSAVNPCEKCKKRASCPSICYPKKDYLRHVKKENRKEKHKREH